MNMRMFCSVVFVAGLLTTGAGPANGYPVTFEFSGTINSFGDPNRLLDGSVRVGTPFAGSFTFQSTMTDDLPGDPYRGLYTSPAPPSSVMTVTVGSYHFTGPSREVVVHNGVKDELTLRSYGFQSEGLFIEGMGIWLMDMQGTALASDALLLAPPALAPFEVRDFSISGNAGGTTDFGFGGVVAVLTPEPASVVLVAIGALVALGRRRRS